MLRSDFVLPLFSSVHPSEATTFLPTYVLVALQDYPIVYQKVEFAPLPPQASICHKTVLYGEKYSALLDIAINHVATLSSPELIYSCHFQTPSTEIT